MPFNALGLGPNLTKAVQEAGYTEPTPIQSKAIPVILTGRDIIGIAQTGTGKTAAFVLPILQLLASRKSSSTRRIARALVVAPTRELVVQIEENVRNYARHTRMASVTIFGGVGENPQIAALRSGVELIIATPGRLIDLMQQGHVDLSAVEIAVLDEADRMLDMGFLPPIRQIVRALPKERQTLLFSATLSPEIEKLTNEFQKSPQLVQIGKRSNPAETVTQFVYEVGKSRKLSLLLHLLQDKALDSVLVFSRTKHGADKIARKLAQGGVGTATLHSNRSQNQRLAALRDFKTGKVRVLVATDIAARGIDVEGISHVVNFDFPPQPEDYVHRIGRTGRAHAVGDAISFVTSEDYTALRALERFISRGIPRMKAADFDYTETNDAPYDAWTKEDAERRRQNMAPRRTTARPQSHAGSARPQSSGDRHSSGARPQASRSSRPASGRPSTSSGRPSAGSGRPAAPAASQDRSRGRRRP